MVFCVIPITSQHVLDHKQSHQSDKETAAHYSSYPILFCAIIPPNKVVVRCVISHGKEQVSREGGVLAVVIKDPRVMPELYADLIPRLQLQRGSIRGTHVAVLLTSKSTDDKLSVFPQSDSCRDRCVAMPRCKHYKEVGSSGWSCEDPCGTQTSIQLKH